MRVLAQDARLQHPTTLEMGGAPVPPAQFFSPSSAWRTPITDYTPYQHPTIAAASSRNWVISLCDQMDLDPDTGLLVPGGSTNKAWMGGNIPCYVVPAGYPRRPFAVDSYGLATVGGSDLHALLQEGVPAPLDITYGVSGVNDAWVNIYQPSTDTLWEIFKASRSTPSGPLDTARWGGVIFGVSKHSATYSDETDAADRVVGRTTWSGNATSISNIAGLTFKEEVATAIANNTGLGHALSISVGHAQQTPIGHVLPATRGDGDQANAPGYIPEGARITFPPGSDFTRVAAYPEFVWAAKTIQTHGIIPVDKTGFGCALHLRDYSIAGDDWFDVLTLYQTNSSAPYYYVSSLPWNEAVVVAPPT